MLLFLKRAILCCILVGNSHRKASELLKVGREHSWNMALGFFEESHNSSWNSDRAKFSENEWRGELMSSFFMEPILTKGVFMWALQCTRKVSWAEYANNLLSAVFYLSGEKILVMRVKWSHKSELQDMEIVPGIQPLKVYLRCCAPSDPKWII